MFDDATITGNTVKTSKEDVQTGSSSSAFAARSSFRPSFGAAYWATFSSFQHSGRETSKVEATCVELADSNSRWSWAAKACTECCWLSSFTQASTGARNVL